MADWRSGGGGGGGGPGGGGRPQMSRAALTKTLKESVRTGHPTGLPEKILRLFVANPPLPFSEPRRKRKPRPAYSGVAQYLSEFASPGDAAYEPPPRAADRPPSPRRFANFEFPTQARIDAETKVEKDARLRLWREERHKKELEESVERFDPNKDPLVEVRLGGWGLCGVCVRVFVCVAS